MRDTVTPAGSAIHLGHVSKVFGKADTTYRAVDGLDLDVRPGQMLALLGKTGCGKSTIFNMIAGLTEPTSGTVRVSGRDPFRDFDSFRGKMAIVFQSDRLLPWRTAIQNVELGFVSKNVLTFRIAAPALMILRTVPVTGKAMKEWLPLFQAPDPAMVQGASVTFEPGGRTAWHTHPLGQTLIVTAGCGWVQREGGPIEEIRPGDVVWFPPGEKHWHGATPTTAMTHIAIQEKLDGKVVDWMEQVSDEQYRK